MMDKQLSCIDCAAKSCLEGHNPAAALYTARSYYSRLFQEEEKEGENA